jgi:hypothetical protein
MRDNPFLVSLVGRADVYPAPVIKRFLDWILHRMVSNCEPFGFLMRDDCNDFSAIIREYTLARKIPIFGWFESGSPRILTGVHGVLIVPGETDRRSWDVAELAAEQGKRVRVLAHRLPATLINSPRCKAINPKMFRTQFKAGEIPGT